MDDKLLDDLFAENAQEIAGKLWQMTVAGIHAGELKAFPNIEAAFKAGVMSTLALVDVEQQTRASISMN